MNNQKKKKKIRRVVLQLQSKQSPVEDLLNQADQLISTQRPRAEVYAAMAESLGLAWKELNQQLETRKSLLDLAVAYQTWVQLVKFFFFFFFFLRDFIFKKTLFEKLQYLK